MSLPKGLPKVNARIHCGLTTIYLNREKGMIRIVHAGNMGNRLHNVEENVDKALGKGMFAKLKGMCKNIHESGSPDYLYTRVMMF